MTREFDHYDGCGHKDPDNCSGCALTHGGRSGPNYAGWPLVYMENNRVIPGKWRGAFARELARASKDNVPYFNNLLATIRERGIKFSDDNDKASEHFRRAMQRAMRERC